MPFEASPTRVRRIVLLVAIGALILAGNRIYTAGSSEISGTAIYQVGIGRSTRAERVTRNESPKKFRVATNLNWGWGAFFCMVSVGSFLFYRKLDDTLAEPF
jgi:hypothetical protein